MSNNEDRTEFLEALAVQDNQKLGKEEITCPKCGELVVCLDADNPNSTQWILKFGCSRCDYEAEQTIGVSDLDKKNTIAIGIAERNR